MAACLFVPAFVHALDRTAAVISPLAQESQNAHPTTSRTRSSCVSIRAPLGTSRISTRCSSRAAHDALPPLSTRVRALCARSALLRPSCRDLGREVRFCRVVRVRVVRVRVQKRGQFCLLRSESQPDTYLQRSRLYDQTTKPRFRAPWAFEGPTKHHDAEPNEENTKGK